MVHSKRLIRLSSGKMVAVLSDDTHISRWVKENGRLDHDQNMLPLVLKYINPGDTVIDIGAYIGDHTCAYAEKVGKDGFVVAFEPMEEAFECLSWNMDSCGYNQVVCFPIALSDKAMRYSIVRDYNGGASFIIADPDGPGETKTLDEYSFERVDFIKIDAEGYELEILTGGEHMINNFKPKMLIEVNRHALARRGLRPERLFEWLENHGYGYRNIYQGQGIDDVMFDALCEYK